MSKEKPVGIHEVVDEDELIRRRNEKQQPAEYSDEHLVQRFIDRHHENVRWVELWNTWMVWDGTKWDRDKEQRRVYSWARAIAREASAQIRQHSGSTDLARKVGSAARSNAIVDLATKEQRLIKTVNGWDADDWLLNTPHGTVDLQTGKLREARRDDYITKSTAMSPDFEMKRPKWMAFLEQTFPDDPVLVAFVQRMAAYFLTGSTQEHALFFCYGEGGNGKTTLMETIAELMGDYAGVADTETFVQSKHMGERHPTEIAKLQGIRLARASETEENQYWAVAKVCRLTGGDKISAHFMRQDDFEFVPKFKLAIYGNHKPKIRNATEAIKRRMNLIPFLTTIPKEKQNEKLRDELKAEGPAILAWAIDGCRDWRTQGLRAPDAVINATQSYFDEQNLVNHWFTECCVRTNSNADRVLVKDLYASWKQWCEAGGEYAGSQQRFVSRLNSLKLEKVEDQEHKHRPAVVQKLKVNWVRPVDPQPPRAGPPSCATHGNGAAANDNHTSTTTTVGDDYLTPGERLDAAVNAVKNGIDPNDFK